MFARELKMLKVIPNEAETLRTEVESELRMKLVEISWKFVEDSI